MFKTILLKCVQYLCLFVMTIWLAYLSPEEPNILLYVLIAHVIFFLLLYYNLKWMAKYPIGFWGRYIINGELVVISIILIIHVIVWTTQKTVFHSFRYDKIVMLLVVFALAAFWWNFDLVGHIRKRSLKPGKKS